MNKEKEVYFYKYCKTCTNRKLKENEEPCESCLAEGKNMDSHKPVNYVRRGRKFP